MNLSTELACILNLLLLNVLINYSIVRYCSQSKVLSQKMFKL